MGDFIFWPSHEAEINKDEMIKILSFVFFHEYTTNISPTSILLQFHPSPPSLTHSHPLSFSHSTQSLPVNYFIIHHLYLSIHIFLYCPIFRINPTPLIL